MSDKYFRCTVHRVGLHTIWVTIGCQGGARHQIIPLPKEQLQKQRYIPVPEDIEAGDEVDMTVPLWALEHLGLTEAA